MVLSTEPHVISACSYSGIREVRVESPIADDSEALTQRRASGISFRTLATASLLLGAAVASLAWAKSSGLSSGSLIYADGGERLMTIGLAEASKGSIGKNKEGDIRILVCRDTSCNKFHPHGLVHNYTAFLNRCSTISSIGSKQTNGKYRIVGGSASTIRPDMVLTAVNCAGDVNAPAVYHHPFSLTVGKFTDCCSFEHGGCGFKCLTFAINEVPPAFGGDGMDGGDVRIKVCRNEDCDKVHPHGLVHEYTANLNTCASIAEDTNTKTNGEYTINGATAATLAEGTVLTAKQCGNTSERVHHGDFSLIVGAFTDCCSFRHGGCGFKCITFRQAYGEPASNGNTPGNSTAANGTTPDNSTAENATQEKSTQGITTTAAAGRRNTTAGPTSTVTAATNTSAAAT